ncbi:hypothetical protein V8F20_011571 [Naviculisporaceae sp. PSN 640]
MSQTTKRVGVDPNGDLVLRMSQAGSITVHLFRVCSSTMRRASNVWRTQFKKDNLQKAPNEEFSLVNFQIDGITQNDSLISAVQIVLNMIHGKHGDVKLDPNIEEFHNILLLVRKYGIYEAMVPYTVHWEAQLRSEMAWLNKQDRFPADRAIVLIQAFWEFGWVSEFYPMMTKLLSHAYILENGEVAVPSFLPSTKIQYYEELNDPLKGASKEYIVLKLNNWKLPVPGGLEGLLSQRRQVLVEKFLRFAHDEINARLADNRSACKYGMKDCDRQVLGNLWARMYSVRGGMCLDPRHSNTISQSLFTLSYETTEIFGRSLQQPPHLECSPHSKCVPFLQKINRDLED